MNHLDLVKKTKKDDTKKKGRKMVSSVDKEVKKEKTKEKKSARRKTVSSSAGSTPRKRGENEQEAEWRKEMEKKGVFVDAKEFPKVHRTVGDVIPSYVTKDVAPPHINDIFQFYKEDWKVTPAPFRELYGSGTVESSESIKNAKLLPLHYDGEGEVDGESGPLSKLYTFENETQVIGQVQPTIINDPLLSGSIPLPSRATLIHDLQKDRYNALLLGDVALLSKSDLRPPFSPLENRDRCEILMEMKEFKMGVDVNVDTFYGSVALYHFNVDKLSLSKGRMSEFFHFCLTDSNQSQNATFCFDHPSPELFLVFRFEKNLWGELEHATNFYTKNAIKPKEKAKLEKEGQENSRRLGKFTQPFICAAIQLFPGDLEVVGKELPRLHTLTNLVRMSDSDMSDTSIHNHIKSLMKKEESKGFLTSLTSRQKVLLGRLVFSLCHLQSPPPNRINTSLLPLASPRSPRDLSSPSPPNSPKTPKTPSSSYSPSSSSSAPPTKEIGFFPVLDEEECVEPYLEYTHSLYIYPESANFGHYSGFKPSFQARNLSVSVEVKLDDQLNSPALNCIFGKTTTNAFVPESHTSVAYHEVKPRWFEEVKIKLPLKMDKKHHLLFTFKHINCKGKGKEKVEDEVGYAWLKLGEVAEGREFINILKDGEYDLKVATKLPPGYLAADPAEVVWTDKGREIFSLRTKMVSSLFSSDPNIQNFFFHYDKGKEAGEWVKIGPVVKALRSATPLELSRFFPIIANQLFYIFELADEDVAKECLFTICHMINTISQSGNEGGDCAYRHPIISAYVSTIFQISNKRDPKDPKDTFSVKMIRLWTALATSEDEEEGEVTNSDTFSHFMWFMFDIVVKARVQRLSDRKILPFPVVKGGNEKEQEIAKEITKETIDLMKVILVIVIQPTLTLLRRDSNVDLSRETGLPSPAKCKAVQAVEQLSFFVKDLLPIFPLSSICELTKFFCERIEGNKTTNVTLAAAKFLFLRIVSDHEAFNEVNQPPKGEPKVLETEEVMDTLSARHPLIALVVKEVLKSIRKTISQVDSEERLFGITLLTDLLNRTATDSRYQKAATQRRMFSMYFLFVGGLMEDERENNALTKSVSKKIDRPSLTRILLCFLFILRKVGSEYMRDWMLMNNIINLKFFQILWTSVESFYPETDGHCDFMLSALRTPKETAALKGMQELSRNYNTEKMGILKMGGTATSSNATTTTNPNNGGGKPVAFSSFDRDPAGSTGTINVKGTLRKFKKMGSTVTKRSARSPTALHLHREVSLMITECVWYVMTDFKAQEHVVTKMIEILMQQKHSEEFLEHLFTMIYFYTEQYKEALFLKKTSYCGDITYQLMRFCNFKSKKIRGQAATLLYLFFKKNWELSGHLIRMKLQCSVAVARLVGDVKMKGTRWLSASLKSLVEYSKVDKGVTREFREQLDGLLTQRLTEILHKVSILRKWNNDREMFAGVLFQISKGWRDSPDIRYHWMEALAKRHEADGELEEAAQCRIHLAALVISHLADIKPEQVPYTAQPTVKARIQEALVRAAPNCGPEFVVECNPQTAVAEGMCCSESFTCEGFEKVLKLAAQNLEKVQLFETSLEVSRLLSVSLIHSRNWEDISGLYGGSAKLASAIVDSDRTQSRLFSNYYRVTLYGEKFEENNGQSFIYKEQGFVRLSDLSSRLTEQFGALFGPSNVQILSNSWKGEPKELDPSKSFFQIVAVLPYFTPEDLLKRPSPFERATNLQEFIFETPYSADPEVKLSKAGTKDLGKIKTILKTEHPFPFVLKRIKIIEKEEQKLTPIETNIEIMKDRIQKLNLECDAEIPNAKTLQIVLQGSVLLQVNAGPTEICRVFCGKKEGEEKKEGVIDKDREVMKNLFREFLVGCERALELNSAIIGRDQLEFHQELLNGFARVKEEVESLVE